MDRANRFRRSEDRQRYILAHVMKRFYLSHLMGLKPQELVFAQGRKGKPFCSNSGAPFFNISHSGDWVLFAVSSTEEIGVDVERAQRDVGESTMKHVLTVPQLDKVAASDDPQATFIVYWTQKEAISKALGLGLSIDFSTISCNGDLGVSHVEHSGSKINVSAHILDESHIAAVSVLDGGKNEPVPLYLQDSWDGVEPNMVSLP